MQFHGVRWTKNTSQGERQHCLDYNAIQAGENN